MRIDSIKTNFNTIPECTFKRASKNISNEKKKGDKKNDCWLYAAGVAGLAAGYVAAGLILKGSFEKNLTKKGLEFRDNILYNSKTGEKYTGKIRSYTGTIGLNQKETRIYKDGVISEKLVHGMFGKELSGKFYIDGKECLSVSVAYPLIPYKKGVVSYHYNETHSKCAHVDQKTSKLSVFKWARKFVSEEGWLKP